MESLDQSCIKCWHGSDDAVTVVIAIACAFGAAVQAQNAFSVFDFVSKEDAVAAGVKETGGKRTAMCCSSSVAPSA